MAGKVVNIIPRSSFSFSSPANFVSSFAIGPRAIATPDWASGVLIVRLHAKNFASSSALARVQVANVSISPDDPNVLFSVPPPAVVAEATIANADTAPRLYALQFTAPIGMMLAVAATYSQGATLGACSWEMSVDLVGRDN